MKIEYSQGYKGFNDRKIIVNGITFSYVQLVEILIEFAKIEEINYPRNKGFKGRFMLLAFINEAINILDITDEMKKRYKIK